MTFYRSAPILNKDGAILKMINNRRYGKITIDKEDVFKDIQTVINWILEEE